MTLKAYQNYVQWPKVIPFYSEVFNATAPAEEGEEEGGECEVVYKSNSSSSWHLGKYQGNDFMIDVPNSYSD